MYSPKSSHVPPRPPPLPWPAWIAFSSHLHAPSGREVDGALSRPSRQTEWGAQHVPNYCAFPGHSLSAREGSVRVVIPWNTRTLPRHFRRPVRPRSGGGHGQGSLIDSVERPQIGWHPCLSLWTGWPATRIARQKKANRLDLGPQPAGGLLSRSRDTQSGQPQGPQELRLAAFLPL